MKKRIELLHIYANTNGSAGLYLDEMYCALKADFIQEAIVNSNYQFNYGKKWFYRYSDLSSKFNFFNITIFRLSIRYVELIYSLIKVAVYILKNDIKLINYSLTSDLLIELVLLKFIKSNSTSKIIITCHDVLPFGDMESVNFTKKIKRKRSFFDLADFLLIHNRNSLIELKRHYNIEGSKILEVPFPVMDLNNLNYSDNSSLFSSNDGKVRFGMFGVFREEKGLDVLLKSWDKFYSPEKNVELVLAGYLLDKYDLKESKSLIVVDNFLSDVEYFEAIKSCRAVILPYKRGTNSGIPSSILSLDTLLVSSDIDMFVNNELILGKYLFKNENSEQLAYLLEWLYSLSKEKEKELILENRLIFNSYRETFSKKINFLFKNNVQK